MVKQFVLLLCFTIAGLICKAGQKDSLVYNRKHIVKFAPLALLEPSSTIQFSYEWFAAKNIAFQIEAGYSFVKLYHLWESTPNISGFKFKFEPRLYETRHKAIYFAPEILYKYQTEYRTGSFGRECNNWGGGCSYFQELDYRKVSSSAGGHFKVGGEFKVLDGFVLDIYGGIGLRQTSTRILDLPTDVDIRFIRNEDIFGNNRMDGTVVLPSLSGGFKVGYIIQ